MKRGMVMEARKDFLAWLLARYGPLSLDLLADSLGVRPVRVRRWLHALHVNGRANFLRLGKREFWWVEDRRPNRMFY
jgi:predicted ArsR family transcriptional regulator